MTRHMDEARKAAREAATLKAAEVLKACFEFGGARPVRDIAGEILDAYEAALKGGGMILISCDSAERLMAANRVMRRMIEDVEARGVDLSAYADELNSLAAMFEADAMIAAASQGDGG